MSWMADGDPRWPPPCHFRRCTGSLALTVSPTRIQAVGEFSSCGSDRSATSSGVVSRRRKPPRGPVLGRKVTGSRPLGGWGGGTPIPVEGARVE